MRNHKFRLSDMIPNAWFYKLRDMSKTRTSQSSKKNHSSLLSQSKPPYYQTRESPKSCCNNIEAQPTSFRVSDIDDIFPHLPLPRTSSSSQRKSRRKTIYKPSPRRIEYGSKSHASFDQSCSETCVDGDFLIYKSPSIEFATDTGDQPEFSKGLALESSPFSSGFSSSSADIIIDVKETSFVKPSDNLDAFDTIPVLDLPPIFTKHKKFNDVPDEKEANFSMISPQLLEIEILDSLSIKNLNKEESGRAQKGTMKKATPSKRPARKYASSPPAGGIKLRTINSPRISSKKTQGPVGRRSISRNQKRLNSNNKEGLSESFAVVKASVDPEKDFRESMMEMIFENNIRASKDLEDLLACYLTLNSSEYHELIIKAFEQIWFNVLHIHS